MIPRETFWLLFALGFSLLVVSVGVACSRSRAAESHEMSCERVAFGGVANGHRCENAEAVCMLADNTTAMSCWRKP